MATSAAIIQLRTLIGDSRIGMLTTRNSGAELHSRPLTLGEVDDDARLVFLVDANADWVAGLAADESVNVAFSDEKDMTWVSVAGAARVGEGRATIHRLWSPAAEAFFPEGPDSPNVRVLTVSATTAEYWDAPASRVRRLAIMAGAFIGNTEAKLSESGSITLG